MTRSILASGALACGALACGATARGGEGSQATASETAAPALIRVAPDTIPLGRGEIPTLVLTGRAFVPGGGGGFGTGGGNTVQVGPLRVAGLPADSAGTTIHLTLPLRYTDSTLRGRPSAFTPGQYPVSVITPRGTSNALTLTMIP